MSAPLREIVTPRAEVRADIVRDLEVLLERARRGEVDSFLWFADFAGSARMSWGSSGSATARDGVALIGRLEVLRHAVLTQFTMEGVE